MGVGEGVCSAVCQHPSCWNSRRHTSLTHRPKPPGFKKESVRFRTPSPADSEEGLPTQKVLNLLDEYGEDPYDRYPSRYYGRERHQRGKTVSAMERAQTGGSVPRTRAPNATPASFLASTDKLLGPSKDEIALAFRRKPVSRVEVQEVFDAADLASEWGDTFMARKYFVWAPSKKKAERKKSQQRKEDSPRKVRVKDMTEQMVPLDIEIEREKVQTFQPQPISVKHRPIMRSPPSFLWDPPDFVEPYPRERVTRKEKYFGVYELLDLPKDVLVQVMKHVNERDMLDPFRFAHALMDALPKLEESSSSLSLASSNVLKQKKVTLLDSKLKSHKEKFPESQQMVMLDAEILDQLKVQSTPPPIERMTTKFSGSTDSMHRKKPLPSINGKEEMKKVPNIALGLPEVQSSEVGTKIKPFNYKSLNAGQDFTLGRIPTPSVRPKEDSPESLDDHNSTLHVTMPTIQSELPEDGSINPARNDNSVHSGSPAMSNFVPKTPVVTPATRGNYMGDINGQIPKTPGMSPTSMRSTPHGRLDSAENIPGGPLLHTIPETEHEQTPRGSLAMKSIHFDNGDSMAAQYTMTKDDTGMKSMPPSRELPGEMSVGITPDLWPNVDESRYDCSPPSGTTGSHPQSQKPADLQSEHSSHRNYSRESALQMLRTKPASPAPPPPSPDPQDTPVNPQVNIDDLIETSSEFTITAPPPSDLDDLSRINTPHEATRSSAHARPLESTGKQILLDKEYSIVEEDKEEAKKDELDQFGATEDTFKEELQEEYAKLDNKEESSN